MTNLFQSAPFILTPQDHLLLTPCFYLELKLIHGNIPLHLLVEKCGLQYQTPLSLL